MPVNALNKTRWEEQATAKYLLDPSIGLPVGSQSSPLRVRLPSLDFLGGTSFVLNGSQPKWFTPSAGATVLVITARGGEIYYEINGVTANAKSSGYMADGGVQRIGPMCNMASLWAFSSTADTMVHVNFYRETNSSLAGVWPAQSYQYILRDEFITNRAAGAINGTPTEPGPGTRQVESDTGNNLTISGGRIISAGIVGAEDPKFGYDDAISRVAGRTFKYTVQYTASRSHSGINRNPGDAIPAYGIYEVSGILTAIPPGAIGYQALTTGFDYTLWMTLLSPGGVAIWVQGGGGAYTYADPTLIFVSDRWNDDPVYLYPIIARAIACTMQVADVEVVDRSELASRELLATVYQASPANGVNHTTFANALHCLNFTLPGVPGAGDVIGIHYRQQDATNYFYAYIEYDGAAWDFKLDVVTAGVPANLINVAGVGTPDEIFVVVAGNEHFCFTGASTAHTMRGAKQTNASFNAATEVGAWYDAGTTTLLESFARTWTL